MFSAKKLIWLGAVFCAVFVATNLCLLALHKLGLAFHYIPSWPINVFGPSEATRHHRIIVGLVLLAAFVPLNAFLARRNYNVSLVVVAGFALLLGSNLMQGWEGGFVDPITRDEFNDEHTPQYYHDAIRVTHPGEFFRNYNAIQPTLQMHARTHPPGPVLLVYAMNKTLKNPALMSVAIAAVALVLATTFLYQLLRSELPAQSAGFATFLFLLLPSVQIYYLVTVDALVAALLLGVFYFFKRGGGVDLVVCVALLATAFMLTLISVWIIPVLAGFDLMRRRSVARSSIVIAAVVAIYTAIYFATGLNLLRCFTTASAIENWEGFTLVHHSLDYLVTRVQCIAELVLFFGPYLCVAFVRSWRNTKAETWLAIGSLGALLLAGTFRVGETARICNFTYPFLLLPIARYLHAQDNRESAMTQLPLLVFAQTLLMQAAASYFW